MTDTADVDYSKLKVAELKTELKRRGLSTEGKKNELVERLQTSLGDAALLDDPADDLLDEDVLTDEEVLNESIPSTPSNETGKRPAEVAPTQNKRKIILNRKSLSELPEPEPEEEPKPIEPQENIAEPVAATPASNVIKLSGLSAQERLMRRAVKFSSKGASTEVSSISVSAPERKVSTPATSTTSSLAVLKKRAERFGTIAPKLEKAEIEERKLKRLARFGAGATTTTTTTVPDLNINDKKAERAQRFQVTT